MTGAGCIWALAAIPFGPLVKMARDTENLTYGQFLLRKPVELAYQGGNVLLNFLGFGRTVQNAIDGVARNTVRQSLTGGKKSQQALSGAGLAVGGVLRPLDPWTAFSAVFNAGVVEDARFALLYAECIANIIVLVWCILFLRNGVRMGRDFSTMAFICILFFGLFRVFPFILIYLVERGLDISFLQTFARGSRFLLGPNRSFSSMPAIFFLFAESLVYLFTPDGNWWNLCGALVNVLCLAQIYVHLTT